MVKEKEFQSLVERFTKIMGPVARTLANEAAAESGAKVSGDKVEIQSDAQFQSILGKMKVKIGKIIGASLVENIMKQA